MGEMVTLTGGLLQSCGGATWLAWAGCLHLLGGPAASVLTQNSLYRFLRKKLWPDIPVGRRPFSSLCSPRHPPAPFLASPGSGL